jgi:hypothetical protein
VIGMGRRQVADGTSAGRAVARRALSRAGVVAGFCALATGAIVAAATAGGQGNAAPPDVGVAPPDVVPPGCRRLATRPHSPIVARKKAVCGSAYADVVIAKGGFHTVWAYDGNDVIRARNARPDLIYGGTNRDRAFLDCRDHPVGVEVMLWPKHGCAKAKPKKAAQERSTQAVSPKYPRSTPTLVCEGDAAAPLIRFLRLPSMRAVDATTKIDWQPVTWSGLLYRQDGSRWTRVAQTPWFYDRTVDQQATTFPGNVWRDRATGKRIRSWTFPLDAPGTYRVGVRYHWYAANGTPRHEEFAWARHLGAFAAATRTWCEYAS